MASLRELLEQMVQMGASDLHLTAGSPPVVRVDGKLQRMPYDLLTSEETKKSSYSMLTEKQKLKFEQNSELDFSFGIESMSRFRANIFMQRGNAAVALRQIPYKIKTFEELGLPKVIADRGRPDRVPASAPDGADQPAGGLLRYSLVRVGP